MNDSIAVAVALLAAFWTAMTGCTAVAKFLNEIRDRLIRPNPAVTMVERRSLTADWRWAVAGYGALTVVLVTALLLAGAWSTGLARFACFVAALFPVLGVSVYSRNIVQDWRLIQEQRLRAEARESILNTIRAAPGRQLFPDASSVDAHIRAEREGWER